MRGEHMISDQPELDLLLKSYEATSIMAEKIQDKIDDGENGSSISVIEVPEFMHLRI